MKRKNLVTVALALVVIMIVAGCGEKSVKRIRHEEEREGEPLVYNDHLDNPEWGGAKRTYMVYDLDFASLANLTEGSELVLTSLEVSLSWVDDHSGSDSQDVTDPFQVNITVDNVTYSSGFMDSGNITVALPNSYIRAENLAANTTVRIEVRIGDCGTYAAPPFIFGRLVRYYDTGNDYTLRISYTYKEVWYEEKKG
ncbi:MAG: hypothetical protein J7L88_01395 [Thermoplasmata archaeon]|nr:hypothetical protein [Thermoplasmata archaeon]